jgi:hypothetical protein
MMAFTDDNQLNWDLLDDRDKRYGTSTLPLREHRQAAVKKPESKARGCDTWEEAGRSFQTSMEEVDLKRNSEVS